MKIRLLLQGLYTVISLEEKFLSEDIVGDFYGN